MEYSVIVAAYNAEATLFALLQSLASQTYKGSFEVVVVDDCSTDSTSQIARRFGCTLIRLDKNKGPAHCRNLGAKAAAGKVLIFTDSDCRVAPNWLEELDSCFSRMDAEIIMGKLVLLPSTTLGDSISALGFPAGGSLGFEKVWKVTDEGYTASFSSCNCGIRRDVFLESGGFDESFPYAGGEDSFLAYCLVRAGSRIKYCPSVVASHPARSTLKSFLSWQFKRGVSSFIFSTKVSDKGGFVSLRLWSTMNIVRTFYSDRKFPLILLLLGTSFVVQMSGFAYAKYKR